MITAIIGIRYRRYRLRLPAAAVMVTAGIHIFLADFR